MATDPDAGVREAVAGHPAPPVTPRDLLAHDPDMFVRNAVAGRPDTPSALRDDLVATLQTDDPIAEWTMAFTRQSHTCPPRAPAPAACTREQAEVLLARADL